MTDFTIDRSTCKENEEKTSQNMYVFLKGGDIIICDMDNLRCLFEERL